MAQPERTERSMVERKIMIKQRAIAMRKQCEEEDRSLVGIHTMEDALTLDPEFDEPIDPMTLDFS